MKKKKNKTLSHGNLSDFVGKKATLCSFHLLFQAALLSISDMVHSFFFFPISPSRLAFFFILSAS